MNNQFITPSASPAPNNNPPHRAQSPSKRPRLTSSSTPSTTSSSTFISTPPAFSNQTYHIANTDGVELHDARRASSFRVLNVWSQLAERYSRPLAEDDIVDLRTGSLIKDRNIIRSAPHQYDIGCLGDADAGTESPTEEGSDDELDAFAPGADISDELEMERVNREGLVPVREMDPADAEDLREFLEAENRRREQFGSEGDEEGESLEGEGGDDEEGVCVDEVELPGVAFTDGSTDEVEDGLVEDDQWQTDPGSNHYQEPEPEIELELDSREKHDIMSTNGLCDLDSGSDDELGIWDDQDEGSTVYAIAGDLDSDEVDGIIELPLPVAESPPSKRGRGRSRKSIQSQAQDQIPPLQILGSKSKSISKSKKTMSPPMVQLHTPPQSSSSATGTTPDIFSLSVSRATSSLPPVHRTKPKSKIASAKERPKSKSKVGELPHSDTDSNLFPSKKPGTSTMPRRSTRKSTPTPNPKLKETPSRKKKWEPEVVITRKASNSINTTPVKPRMRPRTRAASRSQSHLEAQEVSDEGFTPSPRGIGKGKGKEKETRRAESTPEASSGRSVIAASEDEDESDDPMALVSSPDQQARRTPAKEPPPLPASDSGRDRFSTPLPITPSKSRGRKRKRVLSSSLEAEPDPNEQEERTGMGMGTVISPDIDLIDFSKRCYDEYGYGMGMEPESPVPVSKSVSRGKQRKVIMDADSDPQQAKPSLKIAKRSASTSRIYTHMSPPSDPTHNHNSDSSNTHHYPYSDTYTSRDPPNRNYHQAGSIPPPQQQQQHPSAPPIQGPQAQFLLAQAMHHLSYLMTASGHAHPNAGHPPWPQSSPGPPSSSYAPLHFNAHNTNWASYTTPTHPRHRQPSDVFDSPPIASSSASISASTYTTPVHPHPYPYAFTPSLSNGTLPPSSPDQTITSSSPHTSPGGFEITRSKSLVRGRSKSRGRRVSFRIDDDRSHGLNDRERDQGHGLPLRFENQDDDVDELGPSSPSKHAPATSSNRSRSKSARRESSSGSVVRTSPMPRNKGKGKAVVLETTGDATVYEKWPSRAHSRHRVGRRFERGQTPGPPSIVPAPSRSQSILRHEKRS